MQRTMEKSVERLIQKHGLHVSSLEQIGQREYMEDRVDIRVCQNGILVTLCDGHGGHECAQYVIENYPSLFESLMTKNTNCIVKQALIGALEAVSAEWDRKSLGPKYPVTVLQRTKLFKHLNDSDDFRQGGFSSGTTLLVAYLELDKREVTLLNLGDSRASWLRNEMICSTRDHKPTCRDVLNDKRLNRFPIWIEMDDGIARLNGDLAVGRAIGDNTPTLTGCLSRQPSVYTVQYPDSGLKLILASDGLWDEADTQDLFDQKQTCHEFIENGTITSDNISIVYIVDGINKKTTDKKHDYTEENKY